MLIERSNCKGRSEPYRACIPEASSRSVGLISVVFFRWPFGPTMADAGRCAGYESRKSLTMGASAVALADTGGLYNLRA